MGAPVVQSIDAIRTADDGYKRVSVIVPIHNRAAMLEQLILAIRNQTYPDVELIVIDDGSTDLCSVSFWSLVRRVAPKMVVQYAKQPQQGVSSARNHGLALSSGEYLYFLDSDDLIMPWALLELVETLERGGGSVAVARILDCDFELRNGRRTKPVDYTSLLDHYWHTHSALYRAHAARDVGGFRVGLSAGEDLLFNFMIRLQQKQVSLSPTVIGVRRLHAFGHLHQTNLVPDEWQTYLQAFADILSQYPEIKHEPRLKRVKLLLNLLHRSLKLSAENRPEVVDSLARAGEVLLHDRRLAQMFLSMVLNPRGRLRFAFARRAIAAGQFVQSFYRHMKQPEARTTRAEQKILDDLRDSLAFNARSGTGSDRAA